jgi:hypothetical protein
MPDPEELKPTDSKVNISGWRTSEFWLSMIAIITSALILAEVFPSDGIIGKLLLVASIILSSLGYTVARAYTKVGILKSNDDYNQKYLEVCQLKKEVEALRNNTEDKKSERRDS